MDAEEGGIRLSKRFSDKHGSGEVDYKTKAGTAWSHNYLNQKPWHPLSYRNQRRKWIAEQTHAQRERRGEEVAREYAQEQEFFRQTAMISKREREKVEMMKAVSFMYVRPPGYNAESAKAAEVADERRKQEQDNSSQGQQPLGASTAMPPEAAREEKKKSRPKDVFGRPLPTEEEFEILKNAPRLETGAPARVKPFAVEVRNVKCLRCGTYGHQSGDRECPLKDAIMPNEESRLKRDDPLTAIVAHTDPSEPLKWELKQKPGLSPPRGGFNIDDPNQQIVAEDIFDEYGGFLGVDNVPELFANLSPGKCKKKKSRKGKKHHKDSLQANDDETKKKEKKKTKKRRQIYSDSSFSEGSDSDELDSDSCARDKSRRHKLSRPRGNDLDRHQNRRESTQKTSRHSYSSEDAEATGNLGNKQRKQKHSYTYEDDYRRHSSRSKKRRHKRSYLSEDLDSDHNGNRKRRQKDSYSSEDSDSENRGSRKNWQRHLCPSEKYPDRKQAHEKREHRLRNSSEDSDSRSQSRDSWRKHSYPSKQHLKKNQRDGKMESGRSSSSEDSGFDRYPSSKMKERSYSSKDDSKRHQKRDKRKERHY